MPEEYVVGFDVRCGDSPVLERGSSVFSVAISRPWSVDQLVLPGPPTAEGPYRFLGDRVESDRRRHGNMWPELDSFVEWLERQEGVLESRSMLIAATLFTPRWYWDAYTGDLKEYPPNNCVPLQPGEHWRLRGYDVATNFNKSFLFCFPVDEVRERVPREKFESAVTDHGLITSLELAAEFMGWVNDNEDPFMPALVYGLYEIGEYVVDSDGLPNLVLF